ncbi:MAG: PRC-barrel domain-containing protein, partial [Nitrosotalea sp.]
MATQVEYNGKHIKADDFKGKKVIDREGIVYGTVKHIHINTDTLEVVGITVHKGLH